jgi:NAD(P)H-dependent FMN reductase
VKASGAVPDRTAFRVLAIDGSPAGGGRTRAALAAVASGAAEGGATVETIALGSEESGGVDRALEALKHADAIVLGSPVYRASSATPLKNLLDLIPRSNDDGRESPLAGKAVAIVHTGASLHHFLSLDALRNVLAGFFAAHVVPPGLYVPRNGFGEGSLLLEPYADQARRQGRALSELAELLRESAVLRSLRPHA